jgi:hypothetical protein
MKLGNESDLHYIWHLMLWLPAFFPSAFAKSFLPPFWALFFASLRKESTHRYEGQILVATVCRIIEQRAALGHAQNVFCQLVWVGACAFLSSLSASCSAGTQDHSLSSLMMIIIMMEEALLDRSFWV